jgi:hypothetical protein
MQKPRAVAPVTAIIFIAPIVAYGLFLKMGMAQMPSGSLVAFLAGVLVSNIGTAIAFVLLFTLAPTELGQNWLLYALIWWIMYALSQIGQAIGPTYPISDAIVSIISEAMHFPLSAYLLHRLFG